MDPSIQTLCKLPLNLTSLATEYYSRCNLAVVIEGIVYNVAGRCEKQRCILRVLWRQIRVTDLLERSLTERLGWKTFRRI